MAPSCKRILAGWYVCQIVLQARTDSLFIISDIKIENGSARQLIGYFDVKKRIYHGNTSMESEISLLMTNQTLVSV